MAAAYMRPSVGCFPPPSSHTHARLITKLTAYRFPSSPEHQQQEMGSRRERHTGQHEVEWHRHEGQWQIHEAGCGDPNSHTTAVHLSHSPVALHLLPGCLAVLL